MFSVGGAVVGDSVGGCVVGGCAVVGCAVVGVTLLFAPLKVVPHSTQLRKKYSLAVNSAAASRDILVLSCTQGGLACVHLEKYREL